MIRRHVPPFAARIALICSAVVSTAAILGGCAPVAPDPTSTPTSSATPAPSGSESAPPAAPALVPDGTANENLPYFAQIVASVWAGPDNGSGRAYIDALTAAGFDKAAMQVTEDFSTVGNRAESLQFSVQWGAECLVGQVGPATGDPWNVVVPALAEGGCLIGGTRPIDW